MRDNFPFLVGDDPEPEFTVLPGIFERMMMGPADGNATQHERAGAVSLFGFVFSPFFMHLSDDVELFEAASADVSRLQYGGN